ncbi:hypothetical protein EDD16DRAFT_1526938 [Pisolithus croceorrhizus]|nr:hypothetical protein EDD16DRAFT_1526938 [Pisolithus croceorrhizus]KAI6131768.1 hypothetical protein EV401DRAFT_1883968 [Pisolithus croceorrhizus]
MITWQLDLHSYSCMPMQLEHAIKLMKSKSVSSNAMEKGRGGANLLKGNHKCKSGGRPVNAEHTFSKQSWGSTTSSYFQLVSNHEPHILKGIIQMSHAILQDDLDDNSSVDDLTEDFLEGQVDAWALMCVVTKKKMQINFINFEVAIKAKYGRDPVRWLEGVPFQLPCAVTNAEHLHTKFMTH